MRSRFLWVLRKEDRHRFHLWNDLVSLENSTNIAAVPVFAVCDVRLAAPGTIFMVHETSLWKWPGRETASDIRSQTESIQLLRERYFGKLAVLKLDRVKWEKLEYKTTWFSAEKAMDWGLVDRIE